MLFAFAAFSHVCRLTRGATGQDFALLSFSMHRRFGWHRYFFPLWLLLPLRPFFFSLSLGNEHGTDEKVLRERQAEELRTESNMGNGLCLVAV